jgi:alpha-glucuronidase
MTKDPWKNYRHPRSIFTGKDEEVPDMKAEEYVLKTTMSERDRLWEEIEEIFGSLGATEIDEFLDWARLERIDDTDRFREEADKFKGTTMPKAAWWDEVFENYYYDIEYVYFADRWIQENYERIKGKPKEGGE